MSEVEFFFVLLEFKSEEKVVVKKKIKLNSPKSGKELKVIIDKEIVESEQLKSFKCSKILIKDADFDDELVDIGDEDVFSANTKVFIQLSLVYYLILNITLIKNSFFNIICSFLKILGDFDSNGTQVDPALGSSGAARFSFNHSLYASAFTPSPCSSPSTRSISSSASSTSVISSAQASASSSELSAEAQEIIVLVKRNKSTFDIPDPYSGPTMQWRMRVIRLLGTLLRNKALV